jgi:ribosomal protein S18 acetylase RimI-like enzyme
MPTAFTIRLLTLSDLPAYKALREQSLKDFPEAFTSDYAAERLRSVESFAQRITQPEVFGNKLWGAFDTSGQIVGSIGIETHARAQQKHIASLVGMFVSPSAQGQGIATKLVAYCAEFLRATGQFDQIILTVTASNIHVVRLYERAGFVRYGLLPRAICVSGVFHDKLLMRLELRPALPSENA